MTQFHPQPSDVLILVANEAGIGAVLLAETGGHLGIGDVVQLMGHGFEHHAVHDLRHVAGGAEAAL